AMPAEGGPSTITPPATDGGASTGGISTWGGLLEAMGVQASQIPSWLAETPSTMGLSTVASLGPRLLIYGALYPFRFAMMVSQLARQMGAAGSAGTLAGAQAGGNGAGTLMTQIGEFVNERMQGAVGTLVGHFNTATHEISAKLGQAASMGSLKVPQAW